MKKKDMHCSQKNCQGDTLFEKEPEITVTLWHSLRAKFWRCFLAVIDVKHAALAEYNEQDPAHGQTTLSVSIQD
jgi:hypothetical protein